mmetsp:Transcript_39464/g.104847  ORF Transcript_39464/g.104847 Transcript_39464/m.104847 type:complete len:288 (+) Transcript_39464:489-1352(+)
MVFVATEQQHCILSQCITRYSAGHFCSHRIRNRNRIFSWRGKGHAILHGLCCRGISCNRQLVRLHPPFRVFQGARAAAAARAAVGAHRRRPAAGRLHRRGPRRHRVVQGRAARLRGPAHLLLLQDPAGDGRRGRGGSGRKRRGQVCEPAGQVHHGLRRRPLLHHRRRRHPRHPALPRARLRRAERHPVRRRLDPGRLRRHVRPPYRALLQPLRRRRPAVSVSDRGRGDEEPPVPGAGRGHGVGLRGHEDGGQLRGRRDPSRRVAGHHPHAAGRRRDPQLPQPDPGRR